MTVAHKLRQNKSPVKKQDRASETTPPTRIVDRCGEKSRSNHKVNVVTSVGAVWNPIKDATWKLRHWQWASSPNTTEGAPRRSGTAGVCSRPFSGEPCLAAFAKGRN